jgi:hypothetical protein
MVQAVSRRSLTAEARVQSRVSPCGICGGQSGTGTGFSPEYFGFPLSVSFYRCPITRKNKKKNLIIFITGLHNKPQGLGVSVASAVGPFTKKGQDCHTFWNIGIFLRRLLLLILFVTTINDLFLHHTHIHHILLYTFRDHMWSNLDRLGVGFRVMWTDCTSCDEYALWSVVGQICSFQLISLHTETNTHFNRWMTGCVTTIDISVNGTERQHAL